jgi:catechol 2,3-dioxygenase-like lactoylglutathione lyase family enzyme
VGRPRERPRTGSGEESRYSNGRLSVGVPPRAPSRDFGLVGFDHVDLNVKDRARARRFFVEQLGMEVIGESVDHTFLLTGDQVLGLHDAGDGPAPSGVNHLALRVSEWTGLRSRIGRARVTITGEKEREDSRSLYLRGPEGLSIELVWRPDPHTHICAHPAPPVPVADDDEDA